MRGYVIFFYLFRDNALRQIPQKRKKKTTIGGSIIYRGYAYKGTADVLSCLQSYNDSTRRAAIPSRKFSTHERDCRCMIAKRRSAKPAAHCIALKRRRRHRCLPGFPTEHERPVGRGNCRAPFVVVIRAADIRGWQAGCEARSEAFRHLLLPGAVHCSVANQPAAATVSRIRSTRVYRVATKTQKSRYIKEVKK